MSVTDGVNVRFCVVEKCGGKFTDGNIGVNIANAVSSIGNGKWAKLVMVIILESAACLAGVKSKNDTISARFLSNFYFRHCFAINPAT